MTTESKPNCAYWPTESDQAKPEFRVIASCHKGDLDAGIYINGDSWYYLTWQDGVANSWRERYAQLSLALSRLAVIACCEESEWELFAVDVEEADFIARARPFLQATVI